MENKFDSLSIWEKSINPIEEEVIEKKEISFDDIKESPAFPSPKRAVSRFFSNFKSNNPAEVVDFYIKDKSKTDASIREKYDSSNSVLELLGDFKLMKVSDASKVQGFVRNNGILLLSKEKKVILITGIDYETQSYTTNKKNKSFKEVNSLFDNGWFGVVV